MACSRADSDPLVLSGERKDSHHGAKSEINREARSKQQNNTVFPRQHQQEIITLLWAKERKCLGISLIYIFERLSTGTHSNFS